MPVLFNLHHMNRNILLAISLFFTTILCSCHMNNPNTPIADNKSLAVLLDKYYEERLQLFPIEATTNGDNRYNDKLYADFTDSYRQKLDSFYHRYLSALQPFKREELNANDRISYDVFKREMEINIEGLGFHDNYFPLNQIFSPHLFFAQMGSGSLIQPFKTVQDYDNWLQRIDGIAAYMDSAIVYFRKGIATHTVLPKALVVKMIPQMQSFVTADVTKNVFYGPITHMPDSFSSSDKKRLTEAYTKAITKQLIPAYQQMGDFLQKEYLPQARTTSGINGIPGGDTFYNYCIRLQTTTNKTPDEIYHTGLAEVKRIREEMEKTKAEVGFTGDLNAFFAYMKTDKKFTPYKTPEEVLNAFERIHQTMEPHLKQLFGHTPKTPFEIRRTEAFREASASAEYNQGSPDGSRPGIFYVPIIDATQFNVTSGMESLFLHEAIPGHHYQISLQQENSKLPAFRRFGGNNAYAEGWALYCESLGKELGLYTDPYQYMGALGDEMLRATRLVVDAGLHSKNMTREEAIKYMLDNQPISEQLATSEIERYMAAPAQALGYKIGALKLRELRARYEKELGSKFRLADFHDELLKDGNMPLDVLEKKMDAWAESVK